MSHPCITEPASEAPDFNMHPSDYRERGSLRVSEKYLKYSVLRIRCEQASRHEQAPGCGSSSLLSRALAARHHSFPLRGSTPASPPSPQSLTRWHPCSTRPQHHLPSYLPSR
eukprot:1423357-Rhodomonas_salina.3